MVLTVKWYKQSNETELKRWLNDYNSIQNGTYKYDGSLPVTCTNSLVNHKLQTCTIINTVLGWFNENELVFTNNGNTTLGYYLQQIKNTNIYNEQLQLVNQLYNELVMG